VIRETCPCGATLVITRDTTATSALRAWRRLHRGHQAPTVTPTTTTEVRGQ